MGQRKHKKRAQCEGGHFLVIVQESDAAPDEILESYVDINSTTKEEVEEHFYSRLSGGDVPNNSMAFIYECNLVSMVGGHRPQP